MARHHVHRRVSVILVSSPAVGQAIFSTTRFTLHVPRFNFISSALDQADENTPHSCRRQWTQIPLNVHVPGIIHQRCSMPPTPPPLKNPRSCCPEQSPASFCLHRRPIP